MSLQRCAIGLAALAASLSAAACGKPAPPQTHAEAPAAAPQADAPPFADLDGDVLQGPFTPSSANARALGDLSWTAQEVALASGLRFPVEPLNSVSATDAFSEDGRRFDDLAPGDDSRVVDLRAVPPSAGVGAGLCAPGAAVAFLALVHDQPITQVAVIAFTGADPPGPYADAGEVCGVFLFVSPSDEE
jgi:hypothetical protein